MTKVGVLALQGDFEAHSRALARAGAEAVLARTASDLQDLDGLVIPGGESTTMLKLLNAENMVEPLAEFGRSRPIFGTCAGAILLAREVIHPAQQSLELMDLTVERNGYGRQIDSRVVHVAPAPEFGQRTHPGVLEAVFIRAPIIRRVGPEARVLATYQGDPVLVEEGRHLVATFHPELSADSRVHDLFLSKAGSSPAAKKVLFVCIGNCCRSPMAEGFANRHGAGILAAESAGLRPAGIVVEQTVQTMAEKNIDISGYSSKALRPDKADEYDLIVNMSGFRLPEGIRAPTVEWDVPDPIGESDAVYARVRDRIEALVIQLVKDLQRAH